MSQDEQKEQQVVRMQKLRRAVKRLRKTQATVETPREKETWLAWLKTRLGLTGGGKSSSE